MRSSLYCSECTSASIFSEICKAATGLCNKSGRLEERTPHGEVKSYIQGSQPQVATSLSGQRHGGMMSGPQYKSRRRGGVFRTSSYSWAVRDAPQSSRMLRSLILATKLDTSSSSLCKGTRDGVTKGGADTIAGCG